MVPYLKPGETQNWPGYGWFRISVTVDSSSPAPLLGIQLFSKGAARIFLNGKFVTEFGRFSTDADSVQYFRSQLPVPLAVHPGTNDLLIAYANHRADDFTRYDMYAGFSLYLDEFNGMHRRFIEYRDKVIGQETLFIVISLLLAFVHISLLIFDHSRVKNLTYSIFLFLFAGFIFIGYHDEFFTDPYSLLISYRLGGTFLILTVLAGTVSIFALFKGMPRILPGYLLVAAAISLWSWFYPGPIPVYAIYTFVMIVSAHSGFAIFQPFDGDRSTARIIRAGFIVMSLGGITQMLVSLKIIPDLLDLGAYYFFGVLVFILSMSLALARDFAITSRNLQVQLDQVRDLSERTLQQERHAHELELQRHSLDMENQRKSRELEAARQLQLSMLPAELPKVPGLDIAVYMSTATEVGGDYYDFHQSGDDSLYLAIGDATGHGTRAGTMVAVVKSMFAAEDGQLDLPGFFSRANRVLRNMNLGRMYMGLTLLHYHNRKIEMISAGMPPVFLLRADTGNIEPFLFKRMPLGGPGVTPENYLEFSTAKDDILLLFSDGLPELFNLHGEQFGEDRIIQLLKDCGGKTAEEVVTTLQESAQKWRGRRAQQDDITLMAVVIS
jgi:serine phosphatase RsbU (regulator of sigma subunit)